MIMLTVQQWLRSGGIGGWVGVSHLTRSYEPAYELTHSLAKVCASLHELGAPVVSAVLASISLRHDLRLKWSSLVCEFEGRFDRRPTLCRVQTRTSLSSPSHTPPTAAAIAEGMCTNPSRHHDVSRSARRR